MKRLLISISFIFCFFFSKEQTANNFPAVAYTLPFCYGTNTGYYGSQFTNPNLAWLQYIAGGKNMVIYTPQYGMYAYPPAYLGDIAGYDTAGMNNNFTFVLGGVWSGDQLDSSFDGIHNSFTWRGEYQAIWTDSAAGIIDTANRFANYVYQMVTTYNAYVSTYTIINEVLYSNSIWSGMPTAGQLPNFYAPYPYYVRLMKIAWQVIRRFQPTAHISIAGALDQQTLYVGNTYTDNPGAGSGGTGAAGSVSAAFPLPLFAYMDVYEEHWYSQFTITGNINSDSYVQYHLNYITQIKDSLSKYGYNDTAYPAKPILYDETGANKTTTIGYYGSDSLSRNYQIKNIVLTQLYGVKNGNDYALGDYTSADGFNNMGKFNNLNTTSSSAVAIPNNDYYANLTASELLYGWTVDVAATTALSLPSNILGAVFDNGTSKTLVLWAKSTLNEIEYATASYTLPTGTYTRKEWNYSLTNTSTTVSGAVTLASSPSFFTYTGAAPPIVVAGKLVASYSNGLVNVNWNTQPSSLQICYSNGCTTIAVTNVITPMNTGQMTINSTGYNSDTVQVTAINKGYYISQFVVPFNEAVKGKWTFQNQTGNYNAGMNTIKINVANLPHGIYDFKTTDLDIKIQL